MQFYIMTLFPDMVMDGLNTSIIGRAMDKGLLDIEAVNIRDYAFNKHNSVDDYPYGGGAGMLMQAEPVYQCYEAVKKKIETKALLSDPGTRKSPRVFICLHRERHLTRRWQRNLPRKKIWYFCADIMKELMNGY